MAAAPGTVTLPHLPDGGCGGVGTNGPVVYRNMHLQGGGGGSTLERTLPRHQQNNHRPQHHHLQTAGGDGRPVNTGGHIITTTVDVEAQQQHSNINRSDIRSPPMQAAVPVFDTNQVS